MNPGGKNMNTVRVTSKYWLDQVRRKGEGFRIEVRTNIAG